MENYEESFGESESMGKTRGGMAYTRREYVHSVPQSKVTRYTLGGSTGKYEFAVSLVASNDAEISSNALEAARVTTNKAMTSVLNEGSFELKVVAYPHEIVREHKMMAFAGADRLSQGMSRAFGRPTGRAARVRTGQRILTVLVNKNGVDVARKAFERSSKKLPVKHNVVVEQLGLETQ